MLSFVRPDAHGGFAAESQRLLGDVRLEIAKRGGRPASGDFERRELWNGSWKDGRHKKTLAGKGVVSAKCAFCERIRDVNRELDVDHYRPKVKVTRWDGEPPLVSDTPPKEVEIGPGYWWLAFSWENYALSCKECNAGWKRNLFPVREPRPSCEEGVERNEQPLLLDPSTPFNTRDHFSWTVDAIMEGASHEGRATIITCGLNRAPLVAERLKVVRVVNRVLHDFISGLRRDDRAANLRGLGELALLGARSSEFAGMVRWFAEQKLGYDWNLFEGLPD
jgi:hypothetical protein